ncbi:PstS family phosphate ABC transporter substrate-binding protein [Halopseudomonas nanhaiensis]|uniref:PstS family phosphate ABC transporter substrate-binding protein n=1 Tax=Halopseudomonas nanhaiensis TaxID=2830842 RepID=UPI001CBB025D|nr:PstS family phosphate ABC transporter substrate-binding protein [Halopseudomonas nanhaiensis]UAW98346.1 PstS family phosphate ABC transporter substrate-binding protein [Halopseudomonas nanhaiensis]
MKKGLMVTAVLASSLLAQAVYAAETVQIDGSSTVFPISEAMAEEFQSAEKGATRVTVGVSGTGGGFKKFCRGETDMTGASRPISPEEVQLCKENKVEFIELPVAMDALTVVINPQNDWVDHLTVEELKTMWEPEAQGKISNWNQVRDSFPDRKLNLFGPGVDSGTYDYFTTAVVGKAHSSRGDFTASEDDNVLVQGVANDRNALGFFGLAYYEENKNKLKAVPIAYKGKDAVEPSLETAGDGSYQPLTRPLYYYASKASLENKPHVDKFASFLLSQDNTELVQEAGYVPMGDKVYEAAQRVLKEREVGTAYEGAEVGVDVVETLSRKKHY